MNRFLLNLSLTLVVLAVNGQASAATWPDSIAPCNTTLQACVDAQVAGATVEISVLAPEVVGGTLQLSRSITLKSGPAARAQFRNTMISIAANAAGSNTITLQNLRLVDSPVNIGMGSNEALDQHDVQLDQLEVLQSTSNTAIQFSTLSAPSQKRLQISHLRFSGPNIGISASGSPSAIELLVRDSYFKLTAPTASAGNLVNLAGGMQIRWERNRIESLVGTGNPMCLQIQTHDNVAASAIPASVRRNEFLGCGESLRLDPRQIAINATVQNNSFQQAIFHVSVSALGPAVTTLRLSNNIFANAGASLQHVPAALAILNNLYFNAPVPAVAETGRIEADPQFIGADDLRLFSTSPARDGGANAEIPLLDSDFDGQRAVIGPAPDIGAHEWSGALSVEHTATAANTVFNETGLPREEFITTVDLPQAMTVCNGPLPLPAWAPNHFGIYSPDGLRYALFNQDINAALSLGQTFFVLRNGLRDTSVEHFANMARSTVFPNTTRLDHPRLNSQPAVTPVVTQRWDPTGSTGAYNNHPVALWYNANRWHVYNQSNANMPDGAGFHVLVPELFNDYAFRVDVPTPRGAQILDHPRLNNQRCAHLFVSSVYGDPLNAGAPGVNTPSNLLVRYNAAPNGGGYWIVYRGDGADIAAGAAFHVYVDPVHSRQCTQERIFANGFE